MKNITLHDFKNPSDEVEIDAHQIKDMNWATIMGGSKISLDSGKRVTVDENPNHVGLIAGMITGEQCAVGSHSGKYYWRDK